MKTKRKHLTSQAKQTLVNDYKKSRLSAEQFAIQNGVGHSTFMRWRRELISAATPANWPSATNPDPLFVELTQPIEPQVVNNFPDDYKAKDFAQNLNSIGNPITCVIAVPNGVTITVDAIKADQLAQIVQGLLP